MPAPEDRVPRIIKYKLQERWSTQYPLPPKDVQYIPCYDRGRNDIRWSNPSELVGNDEFEIIGVNIYRSFDSSSGPFTRLNTHPVSSQFWRDDTKIRVIIDEDVHHHLLSNGDDVHGDIILQTQYKPIYIHTSRDTHATLYHNIDVKVNKKKVPIYSVDKVNGVITLDRTWVFDVISQSFDRSDLSNLDSVPFTISYKYTENELNQNISHKCFYRITTVAMHDGELIETPIERATSTNNGELERLDYIWEEAIRRNMWILYQGGERVKLFIRKTTGIKCTCYSEEHGRARNDCPTCYGTGYVGGYEGPFDMIIAPDDSEKQIAQSNLGLSMHHSYETWTSPYPMLSQRDFIVKRNGDRYGIGPVRMPTNRGMQLQQHFTVSHLDDSDVRYNVRVDDSDVIVDPTIKDSTTQENIMRYY